VSQAKKDNISPASAMTNTYKVAKRNVLKTLFIVFGCFVLCASCNEFLFLMYFFGINVDFDGTFYHVTVFAMFSNCCLNPLIYAAKYNEFKLGFKRFVDGTMRRKSDLVNSLSTAGSIRAQSDDSGACQKRFCCKRY
jgi:hypothetical protein